MKAQTNTKSAAISIPTPANFYQLSFVYLLNVILLLILHQAL